MNKRLDIAMVERGLVPSRAKAQALIMAGEVLIDDRSVMKAGEPVSDGSVITLVAGPKFVSRGGDKLDHALTVFELDITRCICADIGASTGGFTDVLLQRGALRVFAIDVGYGQLDFGLRSDPRVIVMDRTNARHLESLSEPVDFVSIDASFISLSKLFPAVIAITKSDAKMVALIKPQFEAGKSEVGKKGVVRDHMVHRRVLTEVIESAAGFGLSLQGLTASPLKGPAGNIEFLGFFARGANTLPIDSDVAIRSALDEVPR